MRACVGGTIWALAIDPQTPTTVYAVTDFGAHALKSGVFKSTNGGVSWRAVNVGLGLGQAARTLAIDPQTPAIVVCGNGWWRFQEHATGASHGRRHGRESEARVRVLALGPADTDDALCGAHSIWSVSEGGSQEH